MLEKGNVSTFTCISNKMNRSIVPSILKMCSVSRLWSGAGYGELELVHRGKAGPKEEMKLTI